MTGRVITLAVLAGLACVQTADAALYNASVNGSAGGSWGFVTNEPDWGGTAKTAINELGQVYPPAGEHRLAMFGPGHHAAVAFNWSNPTTHAWALLKYDLGSLYGSNYRATSDAVLNLSTWWNHFNTGFADTRVTDTSNPNWGHGSDNTNWIPGSLAVYEIPAGKLAGSASTSLATVQSVFQNASYNAITANGTDPWLPVAGSMTPIATWDGNSNVQFTIPMDIINRWIADPSSYNGIAIASVTPDEQFRNGAVWFGGGSSANTLSFNYALVPEPMICGLLLGVGVLLTRRVR